MSSAGAGSSIRWALRGNSYRAIAGGDLTALQQSSSTPPAGPKAQKNRHQGAFDGPEFRPQSGASFPADSGADPAARPRHARDGQPDHRPPRSGVRQARPQVPRRHQDDLQDHQPGDHLHRDRHRRVGSGSRQHAVARRPRADGGDRPVRDAVEEDGGGHRAQARVHQDRLAHRRRPRRGRGQSAQGHQEGNQGGLRPAQRDLDRLPLADRPRSARRSTPPAIRRC